MVLGLPASAWVLLILSGGLGLGIELTFYLRHRRRSRSTERPPAGRS